MGKSLNTATPINFSPIRTISVQRITLPAASANKERIMMVAREQFETDLKHIKEDIMALSNMAVNALREAVDALYNQDITLAREVIDKDRAVDKQEHTINDQTILLIEIGRASWRESG